MAEWCVVESCSEWSTNGSLASLNPDNQTRLSSTLFDKQMLRRFLRSLGLLGLLGVMSSSLSAQERFDIAVYPSATAHRGEWELEGHINYTSRGTSGVGGTVAPKQ